MSAAVGQIERALGVQLFIRHHAQGLSLTPAGREFLLEAQSLLRHAAELERFASGLSEEVSGPLGVGCLVTLAPMVIPRLCVDFQRAHPAVEISMVESHQDELLALMRGGRLSAVLTYDLQLGEDISFETLVELPPHAMFATGHPLAGREAVTLERLAGEPMILLDLPLSREYFRALFAARGLEPSVRLRSPNLDVIRALVANGYGYTLINARPRNDRALDGGGLATVRLRGRHHTLRLGIATLAGLRETRTVAAFKEHCRRAISAEGVPGMLAPGA